jgi:hypothetical protein
MQEDEILFTEFFNNKLKEKGLTLKQLSAATGIAMKHLESFGHGRFENLPSAPYVHGYFIKLAEIMDFDPEEWWGRIKEEDTVHRAGSGDRMPGNRFTRGRGRALLWSGTALALVILYFAARLTTILGEPQIFLTAPGPEVTNVTASTIVFEGSIRNGDSLTIGGDSVPLGPEGEFSTEVRLRPGRNVIQVRARKTLGREATLTRDINYDATQVILPAPGAEPLPTSTPTSTVILPAPPPEPEPAPPVNSSAPVF